MPMLPPAPARFSTSTGWPSAAESLSPSARAVTSVEPPGGYGTMSRTGLDGQPCACGASAQSETTRANSRRGRARTLQGNLRIDDARHAAQLLDQRLGISARLQPRDLPQVAARVARHRRIDARRVARVAQAV